MTAARVDVASLCSIARDVLGSASTLVAELGQQAGASAAFGTAPLGRPSPRQDSLLDLISINAAVRVNGAVLPQSLREFVG